MENRVVPHKNLADYSPNYLNAKKTGFSSVRSCFRQWGGRWGISINRLPPAQVWCSLQALEGSDHRRAAGPPGDRGGAQLLQEPRGRGADGGALVLHHRPNQPKAGQSLSLS